MCSPLFRDTVCVVPSPWVSDDDICAYALDYLFIFRVLQMRECQMCFLLGDRREGEVDVTKQLGEESVC